jgi:hypothetical protein
MKNPEFEYSVPDGESAYRDFPFMITAPGILQDFEIGIFTFLYFRASDKTYFVGAGDKKTRAKYGKAAYWSYSKIRETLGTSRTRFSRTIQLFENAGLLGYVSRPRNRQTIEQRITGLTKSGKITVGTNVYAAFIAPRPSQYQRLAAIVEKERAKLDEIYFPDGRLRPYTDKWQNQQAKKKAAKRKRDITEDESLPEFEEDSE